jgi:lipopolysaccharide export system permease protein
MSTFYRYIARAFWGPFAFGLGVFCLLLVFGSLVDRMNFFSRAGAGAAELVEHVACLLPYFVVKMTPLATLLAVLFSLGGMMADGEWKAGLAGGWKPFQMIKPLLACSLLAGAGQLLLQETVAPGFFMRAERIYSEKAQVRQDSLSRFRRDVAFSGGPETVVAASAFDADRGEMRGVVVSRFAEGRLATEVTARQGAWSGQSWLLREGAVIKYDKGGVRMERFAALDSGLAVSPESLVLDRLVPEGLSSRQVYERLRRLRSVGFPSSAENTLLWVKLAAPLSNPVMALIGAAMVLLLGAANRFYSFGLALGVGFFFWAMIIMGQEAGNNELLPPLLAGFLPALAFLAASLWGLRRARAL